MFFLDGLITPGIKVNIPFINSQDSIKNILLIYVAISSAWLFVKILYAIFANNEYKQQITFFIANLMFFLILYPMVNLIKKALPSETKYTINNDAFSEIKSGLPTQATIIAFAQSFLLIGCFVLLLYVIVFEIIGKNKSGLDIINTFIGKLLIGLFLFNILILFFSIIKTI